MIANVRTTLTLVLIIIAFVFVILAAIGKGPLWPAVLCILIEMLTKILPVD